MVSSGIFISHASADRETAQWLAKDLVEEGFEVWLDLFEIEPSDNWLDDIQEGLDSARLLIVVWTKDAVKSRWVPREAARADNHNIPIIPLRFDDTEIGITMQTTQPIDFRNRRIGPFRELVSRLIRYEENIQPDSSYRSSPWRPLKKPILRSSFLDDNNYFTHLSNFGTNEWTLRLVERSETIQEGESVRKWVPASHFVSIVTVPIDQPLTTEFNDIQRYLGTLHQPDTGTRQISTNAPYHYRFPSNDFAQLRTSHHDYVRYNHIYEEPYIQKLERFLRISLEGGIEFADSKRVLRNLRNTRKDLRGLHYVGLLGLAWQLAHFATEMYQNVFNYKGNIQLLINVVNVKDAVLYGFARGTGGGKRWIEPHQNSFLDDLRGFMCLDKNLQFVYQIDSEHFSHAPNASRDLIEDFGSRLLHCFNMKPELYQYGPGTDIFDWDLFDTAMWR